MKCFLCGGKRPRLKYTLSDKTIYECPSDGLHYAKSSAIDKNLYGKDYFEINPHPRFFNNFYFEGKIRKILKLGRDTKPKILDVGCGWGDFLTVCRDKNIDYLGIDESPEAIDICKKKGLNCRTSPLTPSLFQEGTQGWSAITMFQLIEHIKNPLPLLQSAKKLLKKNGVILITTPNNDSPIRKLMGARWSVYNTKSHFVFYNKKNLKLLLEKAGFQKIEVKIDSPRFLSLGYIFSRLFPKSVNYQLSIVNCLPLPTDPFGDLEAVAFKSAPTGNKIMI